MSSYADIVQYYEDKLSISARWLYESGVMTKVNYDNLVNRHKLEKLRTGGNGRTALVSYESLPDRFRQKVIEKIGNPYDQVKYEWFRKALKPDMEAIHFYGTYQLDDGKNLPVDTAKEYYTNAMFLNTLKEVHKNISARRKTLGGSRKGIMQKLSTVINNLREEYGHTLPANAIRLRDKMHRYDQEGYRSLIHRNFGNQNSRKVNEQIELLILSIYVMKNKPYVTMVLDTYLEFLSGKISIVDVTSGEMFNRDDFFNKKGEPVVLSTATIWNYVNDPKNRTIVDSKRNDSLWYMTNHRPHHHRHSPHFSLSKVSLDDRDVRIPMKDGNYLFGYFAYDVTSGALIGSSYSKKKDTNLFIDCMKDMFRNLHRWGYGFPMELEVEHHLVSSFSDDLMKAGILFPFIRFAAAGNALEKRAEHKHRTMKYGYEKRYLDGVGRHYSKLEANRPPQERIWNDDGSVINKEKKYSFDEAVALHEYVVAHYNNDKNFSKKYAGMSRLDVLKAEINPNLNKYNEAMVARYVGKKVDTSIRHNQYVRVQYANYQLPSVESIKLLKPNNYRVSAYYLPNDEGIIPEVHLYQGDEFIGTCIQIEEYNESAAEQTDRDKEIYTEQSKYVSSFDKTVKEGRKKLSKVEIVSNDFHEYEELTVEVYHPEPQQENWEEYVKTDEDYGQLGRESL